MTYNHTTMSLDVMPHTSPLEPLADLLMEESDLDYYLECDWDYVTAQEQWEESLRQITGLVNHVLLPLLGKFLGRRTAHVAWRHFAEWLF